MKEEEDPDFWVKDDFKRQSTQDK